MTTVDMGTHAKTPDDHKRVEFNTSKLNQPQKTQVIVEIKPKNQQSKRKLPLLPPVVIDPVLNLFDEKLLSHETTLKP